MTWVAMSATRFAMPANVEPAIHRLGGIGLFVAEHDASGRWRFTHHTSAIAAGSTIDALLEHVADRLPPKATLIGWNVDSALVPMLLAETSHVSPVVAHHFTARLYRLLTGGAVDMALCHGGMGAAPIAKVACQTAIEPSLPDAGEIADARVRDDLSQVRATLSDEALVLWRMFIRSAGKADIDADAATEAWLKRCAEIRLANNRGVGDVT